MTEAKDYPNFRNLDNCIAHCTIGILGGTAEDIIKNAVAKGCGGPRLRQFVADTSLNEGLLTGVDGEIACGVATPIPGLDDAEFSPFDGSPLVGPMQMTQEQIRERRESWHT